MAKTAIQLMHRPQQQLSPNLNEQDFGFTQLALEILGFEGPSLDIFNQQCEAQMLASSLSCGEFIAKIEGIPSKEIKFAGSGREALLNSLSFILLVLACKQAKYYPHLLTLIKEQFFKPGVFAEYEPAKRNQVLALCRNIEIQLISCGSVYAFCENNQDFLFGFQHILFKIVGPEKQDTSATIEIIRKKFNIDCGRTDVPESPAQCWILGMQKKIYLIEELSYYIVVSINTSTDPNRTMNQSTIQNRLESERSVQDFSQQIIIQASEQSTPKFKDNQQSIRYRKKSHKNSFGGDFQITGYKQLVNLVNKSQIEATSSNQKSRNKKVFSLKFQIQQMSNLEIDEPINKGLNIYQPEENHQLNQEGFNIAKNQVQMRGSHIEGNQGRFPPNKKDKKEKADRKKHITSSEIFQLTHGLVPKVDKFSGFQMQEQNSNTNSNTGSQCENKEGKRKVKETGEANQERVEASNMSLCPNTGSNMKENFKFSFSKKDSNKFIFKEIESEYIKSNELAGTDHKVEASPQGGNQVEAQGSVACFKPSESANLLYEGDYFKKKDKKRSLLFEASIIPIQEEVQSSQREKTEQQSIPQSNQERQKQMLNWERDNDKQSQAQSQQQSQFNEAIGNGGFNWNSGNLEQTREANGNKSFLNIFKTKNRKFSYLTQPISASKNSLLGGNSELRQSYVEESNETTPEQIQHKRNHHNPPNYIQNVHRQQNKNRVSRSPKIHKNSEAITESKHNKRRFEENPISFSQMIANVTAHDDSNFSGHSLKNKRPTKPSLCPNVLEFTKNNIMCYTEPEGWVRKEVIYYFQQEKAEPDTKNLRLPQRYVINRTPLTLDDETRLKDRSNKILNNGRSSSLPYEENQLEENFIEVQRSKQILANPLSSLGEINNHSGWRNTKNQNCQTVERVLNSPNNIRSTIDTSKNTQNKTEKNISSPAKTPYFKKQVYTAPSAMANPEEQNDQSFQQMNERELTLSGKTYSNLSPAATTRSNVHCLTILKPPNPTYLPQPISNQSINLKMHSQPKINSPHHTSFHSGTPSPSFPLPVVRSASPATSISIKSSSNPEEKLREQVTSHFHQKNVALNHDFVKEKSKLSYSPVYLKQKVSNFRQQPGRYEHPFPQQNQTYSYSPVHHRVHHYSIANCDISRARQIHGDHMQYNKSLNDQNRNLNFQKLHQNNVKFQGPPIYGTATVPNNFLYFEGGPLNSRSNPNNLELGLVKYPPMPVYR